MCPRPVTWDAIFYICEKLEWPFAIFTLCFHRPLCQEMSVQTVMHAMNLVFVGTNMPVIKILQVLFHICQLFQKSLSLLHILDLFFIIFSTASKLPFIRVSTMYSTHPRFIYFPLVNTPTSRMNSFGPILLGLREKNSLYYCSIHRCTSPPKDHIISIDVTCFKNICTITCHLDTIKISTLHSTINLYCFPGRVFFSGNISSSVVYKGNITIFQHIVLSFCQIASILACIHLFVRVCLIAQ